MNTHSPDLFPIVGLDEVGRGALAGPVVAGCCAFLKEPEFRLVSRKSGLQVFVIKGDEVLITDSKKMTAEQRAIAARWLYEHADAFGIGIGSVMKINNEGIVKAAHSAFRGAFRETRKRLSVPTKEIFLDAFFIPRLGNTRKSDQRPIIKGDQKELSIAGASIIAKVYRDNLMEKLAQNTQHPLYEVYRWDKNKGYGTREHKSALQKHGSTKEHRTLFIRNCMGL